MPLILGLLLVLSPADTTADRATCINRLPVTSPSSLPVESFEAAQRAWTSEKDVPSDTLRSYIAQFRRARACFRSLPPSEAERPYLDVLYTYEWAAYLHAALRQFDAAFEALSAARAHLNRTFSGVDVSAVRAEWLPRLHQNEGYLRYVTGDLSSSISHYLQAFEATPDTAFADRAEQLYNLGVLHDRVGGHRSARHYYTRAKRLLQDSSRTSSAALHSRIQNDQADLLLERALNGRYRRADVRRARSLARKAVRLSDSGTERHAFASLTLSESLGYLGAFERAYRQNREVRAYARQHDNLSLQAFATYKLGVLHMQTQHWARADSAFREALAMAESLGSLNYQRRILRDLGRLHEMQSEWHQAERYYRDGVEVVVRYRESLTASQWSAKALSQWQDVHRGLVRTLLAQGRPRDALVALDRTRARHLQNLRTQAHVVNELSPNLRVRFDSLTQALTDVRNQLARVNSTSRSTSLRNREAALMAKRQSLLDIRPSPTRPSIDSIQAALARQDRALVSYFLDAPWPIYDRNSRSTAFVLTPDTLRRVPLPGLTQDSVRSLVHRTSPLLHSSRAVPDANAMHFDLRPLHVLYDALYAPVARHVQGNVPLTVVPDGPLFRLPFSALVRRMPGGRFAPSEARFVLHERPVTTELATSLVADTAAQRRPSFDPPLSVFGVSSFDTLRSMPPALRTALPRTTRSDSAVSLPSLPGVPSELRTVDRLVPEASFASGPAATESAFRSACRRAGIVHVATHAVVHPSTPIHNALLLHPDSSSDGILFLHELRSQQRRVPLVVLSGCGTARGTLRRGEGMAGLQYAFRAMGAQATVASLWPVADQASVYLTKQFYRHLRAGAPKDDALRSAKLAYLETHPAKASPFFWAPSVLYGSPEAIPLSSSTRPSWVRWTTGVGAGVLGMLLFWAWYTGRLRRPRVRGRSAAHS